MEIELLVMDAVPNGPPDSPPSVTIRAVARHGTPTSPQGIEVEITMGVEDALALIGPGPHSIAGGPRLRLVLERPDPIDLPIRRVPARGEIRRAEAAQLEPGSVPE